MSTEQTDAHRTKKRSYNYINFDGKPRRRTGYYFKAGRKDHEPMGLMIYRLNNRWRVDHYTTGRFVRALTPKGVATLKGTKGHINMMFENWPKLHAELEGAASGIATVNPPIEDVSP